MKKKVLLVGIIISLFIFSFISVVAKEMELKKPINYGYSDGIMIDNNGLKYTKVDNGLMKVDDSFFTFALTGKIDGVNNIFTPLNFNWDWTMDNIEDNYTLTATANVGWTQIFNFYKDDQMKITHIIENNAINLTGAKFWYIFSVGDDDIIEYDGTKYSVIDVLGKHWSTPIDGATSDANTLNYKSRKIKFKNAIFNINDLIDAGFGVTDVYIGDAEAIGFGNKDVIAIAVTKGKGNFNQGTTFTLDPTLSKTDVIYYDAYQDDNYIYLGAHSPEDLGVDLYNTTNLSFIKTINTTGIGGVLTLLGDDDKIYLGTTNGLYLYNTTNSNLINNFSENIGNATLSIYLDDDRIYTGTPGKAFIWNKDYSFNDSIILPYTETLLHNGFAINTEDGNINILVSYGGDFKGCQYGATYDIGHCSHYETGYFVYNYTNFTQITNYSLGTIFPQKVVGMVNYSNITFIGINEPQGTKIKAFNTSNMSQILNTIDVEGYNIAQSLHGGYVNKLLIKNDTLFAFTTSGTYGFALLKDYELIYFYNNQSLRGYVTDDYIINLNGSGIIDYFNITESPYIYSIDPSVDKDYSSFTLNTYDFTLNTGNLNSEVSSVSINFTDFPSSSLVTNTSMTNTTTTDWNATITFDRYGKYTYDIIAIAGDGNSTTQENTFTINNLSGVADCNVAENVPCTLLGNDLPYKWKWGTNSSGVKMKQLYVDLTFDNSDKAFTILGFETSDPFVLWINLNDSNVSLKHTINLAPDLKLGDLAVTMSTINNKIYAYGGDELKSARLREYDPLHNEWIYLDENPYDYVPDYNYSWTFTDPGIHSLVTITAKSPFLRSTASDDTFYITKNNYIYGFNATSESWNSSSRFTNWSVASISDYPVISYYESNNSLIIGSYYETTSPGDEDNRTIIYNLTDDLWYEVEPLPCENNSFGASSIYNDYFYSFDALIVHNNQTWRMNIDNGTWERMSDMVYDSFYPGVGQITHPIKNTTYEYVYSGVDSDVYNNLYGVGFIDAMQIYDYENDDWSLMALDGLEPDYRQSMSESYDMFFVYPGEFHGYYLDRDPKFWMYTPFPYAETNIYVDAFTSLQTLDNYTLYTNIIEDSNNPPSLVINLPEAQVYCNKENLSLNYTVSDSDGLDTCFFSVKNSSDGYPITNVTITNCLNTTFNLTNDGVFTLFLYANDSYSNLNISNISFTISTTSPTINIDYPLNGTWVTDNNPFYINFTAIDVNNISECQLWLNYSSWHLNETINVTSGVSTNFSLLTLPEEQTFIYNVWCNDSIGHGDFPNSNITFGVDTIYPTLNVTLPSNGTTYYNKTITLNFTTTDTLLDTCWYNITRTASGDLEGDFRRNATCNIDQNFTVDDYSDYIIHVFISDSGSNINSTDIQFTTALYIPPVSPTGGGGASSPPITTNITEIKYADFCGDGVCGTNETPTNCWQDCAINIDNIILCLFTDPKSCIYSDTWFATAMVYFLVAIGIWLVYKSEKKKRGKKGKKQK